MALLVRFGAQPRIFKVITASDQPFTQEEFEKWKRQMEKDDRSLPLPSDLEDRALDAKKKRHTYRYDMKALETMHNEKQAIRDISNVRNLEKQRLQIMHRVKAMSDDDPEKCTQNFILKQIDEELEKRKMLRKPSTMLDSINERNRRNNEERTRRKIWMDQTLAGKRNADPFSRAITKSTIERFGEKNKDKEKDKQREKEANKEKEDEHERNKSKEKNTNQELKNEKSYTMSFMNLSRAEDKDILIKDPLWLVIHNIGRDFCQNLQDITLPINRRGEPIFGRNTNPTSYAKEFEEKPNDRQILSLQDYNEMR